MHFNEARPVHLDRPRVFAEGKCREGGEEVGAHHQFPRRQTSTMRFFDGRNTLAHAEDALGFYVFGLACSCYLALCSEIRH